MFSRSILILIALSLLQLVAAVPVKHKKNIIFMVPDGMGPTDMSLAREFAILRDNLQDNHILNLDPHLVGTLRTHSASSLITDSAAAGTAFSTGKKTYNNAIGVDEDGNPSGTIMEALKEIGYTTGLVVTTKITDATPAVFAAHVTDREYENDIAYQYLHPLLGHRIADLLIGGGKCFFTPQSEEGSCREDDINLISQAQEEGWGYVDTKADFDALNVDDVSLPFLGLFAPEEMPYEIDRNDQTPSLADTAKFALELLAKESKDNEQGFFVMIEGSRIDHCNHDNDAPCAPREILAYDETWKVATDFADKSDVDTLIVSVADHETGGLALAYDYMPSWYPEVLLNKTHSSEYLLEHLVELNSTANSTAALSESIKQWSLEHLAIDDITNDEVEELIEELREDDDVLHTISKLSSDRAGIGYTSGGHSHAYVNVYGYTNSEYFRENLFKKGEFEGLSGCHDNTEIPKFFAKLTGADIDAITERLRSD